MEEEARKALCRQSQAERELENAHEKISKLQSELGAAKSAKDRSFQLFYYIMVILFKECRDIYSMLFTGKKMLEALAFVQSINCKSCVFLEFFGIVSKKFENLVTMRILFMIC